MSSHENASKKRHSITLTIVLFLFWLFLSGKWDVFHIAIGFIAAIFIVWISLPLMRLVSYDGARVYYAFDLPLTRYIGHWIWLIKEIIIANIEVAIIILHPKMPIDPQVVTFKKDLKNPVAQTTLANSITLTPGTLTLNVEKDTYTIHALTKRGAERICAKDNPLFRKIDAVFEEHGVREIDVNNKPDR